MKLTSCFKYDSLRLFYIHFWSILFFLPETSFFSNVTYTVTALAVFKIPLILKICNIRIRFKKIVFINFFTDAYV